VAFDDIYFMFALHLFQPYCAFNYIVCILHIRNILKF